MQKGWLGKSIWINPLVSITGHPIYVLANASLKWTVLNQWEDYNLIFQYQR